MYVSEEGREGNVACSGDSWEEEREILPPIAFFIMSPIDTDITLLRIKQILIF